jgi:hypothetical protein
LLADGANNLWIQPFAANVSPTAPSVYDVVNRQSQIVDRVIIPAGAELIGVGASGVVYLLTHDSGRVTLEAAHVK